MAQLHLPIFKEQPRTLFLSSNDKTGMSINTSIEHTCLRRTAACNEFCYAKKGRLNYVLAKVRQLQNTARFEYLATAPQAEVNREADRTAGVILVKQDFLRFFGGGDLQPGSVRVINAMAKRHPDLTLWVATRRTDLVSDLSRAKNLHVMLSTDATTLSREWAKARALVRSRGVNTYLAYVQREVDDVPPKDVTVVFAEHKAGGNRAKWSETQADPRTCPVTIKGGAAHTAACASCRYCFNSVKRRSKHP